MNNIRLSNDWNLFKCQTQFNEIWFKLQWYFTEIWLANVWNVCENNENSQMTETEFRHNQTNKDVQLSCYSSSD